MGTLLTASLPPLIQGRAARSFTKESSFVAGVGEDRDEVIVRERAPRVRDSPRRIHRLRMLRWRFTKQCWTCSCPNHRRFHLWELYGDFGADGMFRAPRRVISVDMHVPPGLRVPPPAPGEGLILIQFSRPLSSGLDPIQLEVKQA